MASSLHLVLYALAFVLFLIAAFFTWRPLPPPRVNFIALGLAALTLTLIL